MGCCTSILKTCKPLRANGSHGFRAELLEEEKNPVFYRKPSYDASYEPVSFYQVHNTSTVQKDPPSGQLKRKVSNVAVSRKQSEFNLHKDLLESIKKDIQNRQELGLQSRKSSKELDETAFKITQEQHGQIHKFVEGQTNVLHGEVERLYNSLNEPLPDEVRLVEILENLKGLSKDIVNCLDDLKAFPLQDEQKFYSTIDKDFQLVKGLGLEYQTYHQGNVSFEDFKTTVMYILQKYLGKDQSLTPNEEVNQDGQQDAHNVTEEVRDEAPLETEDRLISRTEAREELNNEDKNNSRLLDQENQTTVNAQQGAAEEAKSRPKMTINTDIDVDINKLNHEISRGSEETRMTNENINNRVIGLSEVDKSSGFISLSDIMPSSIKGSTADEAVEESHQKGSQRRRGGSLDGQKDRVNIKRKGNSFAVGDVFAEKKAMDVIFEQKKGDDANEEENYDTDLEAIDLYIQGGKNADGITNAKGTRGETGNMHKDDYLLIKRKQVSQNKRNAKSTL